MRSSSLVQTGNAVSAELTAPRQPVLEGLKYQKKKMQCRPLCEGLRAFSLAFPRFMPPSSPRLVGLMKWSKALAGQVFNEEKGK